jgi:hypothetical protein
VDERIEAETNAHKKAYNLGAQSMLELVIAEVRAMLDSDTKPI